MGVHDLIIEVMRGKGTPMTPAEIWKGVIVRAATAESKYRSRFNEASEWFNTDYVSKYLQRRCAGLEVPFADSEKCFRVVDGIRYALLDSGSVEEAVVAAKTMPPRQPSPLFGSPINFRGLRHAPINELGVVYIFGIVSHELGFIVEALQSSFPDCEAKRSIGKGRWQRVRIEFEFQSSNYRAHKHPLDGADLVVCWEHDWPDCPLEVLELQSAIDKLCG